MRLAITPSNTAFGSGTAAEAMVIGRVKVPKLVCQSACAEPEQYGNTAYILCDPSLKHNLVEQNSGVELKRLTECRFAASDTRTASTARHRELLDLEKQLMADSGIGGCDIDLNNKTKELYKQIHGRLAAAYKIMKNS